MISSYKIMMLERIVKQEIQRQTSKKRDKKNQLPIYKSMSLKCIKIYCIYGIHNLIEDESIAIKLHWMNGLQVRN